MKNCKDCNEFMCGQSGTDQVSKYCGVDKVKEMINRETEKGNAALFAATGKRATEVILGKQVKFVCSDKPLASGLLVEDVFKIPKRIPKKLHVIFDAADNLIGQVELKYMTEREALKCMYFVLRTLRDLGHIEAKDVDNYFNIFKDKTKYSDK